MKKLPNKKKPRDDEENLLSRVRMIASSCREAGAKQKLGLFLKAIEERNILKACQAAGKASSYFYYWWNRFRDSGFKLQALKEKSRRPKTSPRQIAPQVVAGIKAYRQLHHSPEKIKFYLEKEKNIRVSKATIYRVLHREKLPVRKTAARAFGATSPSDKIRQDPQKLAEELSEKIHSLWKQSSGEPKKEEIHSLLQSALRGTHPTLASTPSKPRFHLPPIPSPILAGRYLLERELGRGGAGVVYLVQDQKSRGKRVALKLLPVEHKHDPTLLQSIKNEFASLCSLSHPNLAHVFDFGMTEKEIYFTSEWIEGRDILQATVKANLNTVFLLIVDMLRALEFLHGRGVLHLDLKPGNVLVTDPDRTGNLSAKLIDFGSAEWMKRGQPNSGEFVGTPPYAAPELIQERAPTTASDIYSLGMILHQIFAHRFPFQNQEPFAMMKEQVYQEPLLLTDLHPALPEDFSKILRKMVAKDPRDRFSTARKVLSAINECLGENFSLRSASAPVHILEESEYLFRDELLKKYLEIFKEGKPLVGVLSGPPGSGKSRWLRQLKWSLQLQGIHAVLIEDSQNLREILKNPSELPAGPLLLDLPSDSKIDFVTLLDQLENLKIPVFLSTRLGKALEFNPTHWVEFESLKPESIFDFLKSELMDFPPQPFGKDLAELSLGLPARLESLLLEMREEGWIQWTDRGWRWMAGTDVDFSNLPHRQEARWQTRLQHLQEILEGFPGGLNAKILEGVMGLQGGTLDEKLEEWSQTGEIVRRKTKKVFYYFGKAAPPTVPQAQATRNWPWAEKILEELYMKGEYATGVQWAKLLLGDSPKNSDLPFNLLLRCARHLVAFGEAKRAIKILPPQPPAEPNLAGLFHEILARAELISGNSAKAQFELEESKKSYRQAKDEAGLSRVFNLWGSLHKMSGDFEAAEKNFEESIQWARQVGDDYHQGFAQMNLATLYHDRGQYARARAVYEETFKLEAQARQPLLSCKLRHNWVNLLFHTGQIGETETQCYEWLKLAIQHRYPDQQAATLNYLALMAGQKDHREMQMEYYNQALGLLTAQSFPQLYFQTLLNRAYLHWDFHKFTAAQLDGEAALSLAETRLGASFSCLALLLLGKVLRDRPKPDLDLASTYLNRAHEIAWKNQSKQTLWEAELERGLLAKRKNEKERAKNYFLSAKQCLESYLEELPEEIRQGYLRDRKMERITGELERLDQE